MMVKMAEVVTVTMAAALMNAQTSSETRMKQVEAAHMVTRMKVRADSNSKGRCARSGGKEWRRQVRTASM